MRTKVFTRQSAVIHLITTGWRRGYALSIVSASTRIGLHRQLKMYIIAHTHTHTRARKRARAPVIPWRPIPSPLWGEEKGASCTISGWQPRLLTGRFKLMQSHPLSLSITLSLTLRNWDQHHFILRATHCGAPTHAHTQTH